jgi:hypothetical protein
VLYPLFSLVKFKSGELWVDSSQAELRFDYKVRIFKMLQPLASVYTFSSRSISVGADLLCDGLPIFPSTPDLAGDRKDVTYSES